MQDNESEIVTQVKRLSPDEAIIASVPKEAFKAMFYLFAGKPDSNVKLFRRRVLVSPNDFRDLNDKVVSKLRLHQIDQIVVTANVKFEKGDILEFGTWAEFETHDWKTAHVTSEVSLRWDFLIKLPAYGTPQRHTLTVRLSSTPRPKDIFHILMSQNPDDDVDIETKMALCVARVDFISHRLASELLDIVDEWDRSLPQPSAVTGWLVRLGKYDKGVARFIHFSVPVFMTGMALAALNKLVPHSGNEPVTGIMLSLACRWLLVSMLGLYVVTRFSHFLANRCYRALNEFHTLSPFRITRGDEARINASAAKNSGRTTDFLINAGFAVILNIIAGVITWWMLPK